jgi:hypothetical protein
MYGIHVESSSMTGRLMSNKRYNELRLQMSTGEYGTHTAIKIKTSTLSVIMKSETSTHCYLELNGDSCNVTLRFDRGDTARICGYPQEWLLHDQTDPYDHDSDTTGADLFECDTIPEHVTQYVSKDLECSILQLLLKCVTKQFQDPSWSDSCDDATRQDVINKIENAIKALS